jgi:hypothetical protein
VMSGNFPRLAVEKHFDYINCDYYQISCMHHQTNKE